MPGDLTPVERNGLELPGRQPAHLPMARIALSTLSWYGSGTRYSCRVGGCSNLPWDRVVLTWICSRPGSSRDHLQKLTSCQANKPRSRRPHGEDL